MCVCETYQLPRLSTMSQAVLVDLIHGCCSACTGSSPLLECASDSHVFLLCGKRHRDTNGFSDRFLSSCKSTHVLDSASITECLYRFKQTVDQLELSSVRVFTSEQGRDVLAVFQRLLFTAVYTFRYKVSPVDSLTCPSCTGSAHTDSPGEGVHEEEEEVSAFLQQLPPLRGEVRVLKSTLIPGQIQ